MEEIYKGNKIATKSYELQSGEWMPEVRVSSIIAGGVNVQRLFGQMPSPSKELADTAAIQMGKCWTDSN